MKKIFTLITSILCSISLFAGIPQTRLTVSTNLKSPVIVLVDGQSLNSQRDNRNDDELIINNLSAGYHNIKIYQKNAVRGWGYRTQVIYDGNVYVKPGYHVDVTLNRFGRALIDERQITRDDYDEYDDNIGRSYPGNPQNQGNEPYPRNQQYPSNGGGGYDNENQAMNAGSFAQFRYMLGNISFEDSRLVMARQNI